jgi:cell division septal protein FtsQ
VKFVINPSGTPQKKVYNNLPEREPYKQRRAEHSMLGEKEEEPVEPDTATFLPIESSENWNPYEYEEEPSSWKNSRFVKVLFAAAVLLIGTLGYFAMGFESDLALEGIVVEGAHLLTEKQIIELAAIDREQRFYDIDLKHVAANIEKHSLIKVSYPRRTTNPNTIVLRVIEREPVAMMRSVATGEALIIDREGVVLKPKKLSGLKDPQELLRVPLISGITEKDTVGYLAISRLILKINQLEEGALKGAIGELKRTPTGSFVIYTTETMTPIFIGSPSDIAFTTAIENERRSKDGAPEAEESHFDKQLHLLAIAWKQKLHQTLRANPALYVDARYAGQIVLRKRAGAKLATSVKSVMPAIAQAQSVSATHDGPLVTEFTKGVQSAPTIPDAPGH